MAAITGDSAVSVEPLKALIARYINRQMIEAIAKEGRKGRLLFIGTTELDSDQPIIWSITDIAMSGHPEAMALIHKVLIASASITVAFPPVIFEVEANGRRHDEIHTDGGTSTQIFLYPVSMDWGRVTNRLNRYRIPSRISSVPNPRPEQVERFYWRY